jgi:TRAP-type C4-dicarboxylate transport system substrate-binding protein
LNVFGRAELQRTVFVVVALLVTAGATGAFAREFRAADTQNEDYPAVQALRFMDRQITERQQSEQMREMMRALTAAPVELPYGQVLTGLATRRIDGAGNNWPPSFVTTDDNSKRGVNGFWL